MRDASVLRPTDALQWRRLQTCGHVTHHERDAAKADCWRYG
jgi:hypothetical protein